MFLTLAVVIAAGLLGPLLAAQRRPLVPVVVGELLAGVVLGRTGFHVVDIGSSPAFPVFYELGFAMLMLTAGTHLEVMSPGFRKGAVRGALAVGVVGVAAAAGGYVVQAVTGTGSVALFAVLLAGSSAALAFPIIEEHHLEGPGIAFLVAWIGLADGVTVALLAPALGGGRNLPLALAGDGAIIGLGLVLLVAARRVASVVSLVPVWKASYKRGWGLELRVSLLMLFAFGLIAERTGASTLVAGFVAGVVLVTLHQSRRLGIQLVGLANGFLVPIFFVLLGAKLDLRALAGDPAAIGLCLALALGAVLVHLAGAYAVGRENPLAFGLAASAQLGLPAAAASLGLATHALRPSVAAAIVAAGCLTLVPATVGGALLARAGHGRPALKSA